MKLSNASLKRRSLLAGAVAASSLSGTRSARAEASAVRLSHGFGIHYLPLMVIRDRKLLEKHTQAMGIGKLDISWRSLDGGSSINDAMLSGALDIAGIGAPGFITLWSKARAVPASAVMGICGLGGGALWLNTNNPNIKTLRDFTAKDKIAVPGIKTSFAAVVLQMAAAKEFGIENFAQLDPLTVGLAHPDAFATLVSGKTEITGHVASPPFSNKELTYPNVHRVFTTVDLLGPITIDVAYAPKRFTDANPRIMEAFLTAMDEANAMIAADRDGAADSFLRVSEVNMPKAEIRALLDDPETSFKTAPAGVMSYAQFLGKTGQIKTVPTIWTDLFIPQLHNRAGS
jgi:NitT/TauT family transport system substrate-binding protein